MTDTTGIISVSNTAAIAAPTTRPSQTAQAGSGFTVSTTTASTDTTSTTAAAIKKAASDASTLAPHYSSDPVAGIITQYIGRDGSVVNQVPSVTALAYLRVGLTATGERRPETVTA